MMLKTAVEPDSLIALFWGKMDIAFSKCERLVINETFEPVWIRSPDASYWIYNEYTSAGHCTVSKDWISFALCNEFTSTIRKDGNFAKFLFMLRLRREF